MTRREHRAEMRANNMPVARRSSTRRHTPAYSAEDKARTARDLAAAAAAREAWEKAAAKPKKAAKKKAAKKKAPPRPAPAKKKAAKKKVTRKPSAARGGCAAAVQMWGRSYNAAGKLCEADAIDRAKFGEVGGNASAAAARSAAKPTKKLVKGRMVKV